MPSNNLGESSEVQQPSATSRVRWFPPIWIALLTAIVVQSRYYFEDPGVSNSITHLAVVLGVVGIALWIFNRSGWSRKIRLWASSILLLLLSSHYLQFSPVEFVNNGDVGLVGWRWRWVDPDRQLINEPTQPTTINDWQTTAWDYPRYLGNGYWAEAVGVQLDEDWQSNPPQSNWKQRIGAGWSAFAVVGQYAITQEQRGEREMVTCYDIEDGSLVWSHSDPVRFDPRGGGSLGGVGPQATPTAFGGRVFSHGATGIVNCLEASTGKLLWSCDTGATFGVETLLWGAASSPLIVHDMVVVSVGDARANVSEDANQEGNSLVAFDQQTGKVVWKAGDRRSSYASPVLCTLADVEQVVVVNEDFITSHRAVDGAILWEHFWPGRSDTNASASQPVPVGSGRLFLSKGYGIGSELIEVSFHDDQWKVETVWKKNTMKTKMCNVVVRDGYVYGIDDVNLACIELASGKKMWKKRRRPNFGHGQILLAGEHLVLITEAGEVVLIAADSEEYRELGSFQAIDGVTWNNLAMIGSKLLVRNAEWAACYELPVAIDQPPPNYESDQTSEAERDKQNGN